MFEVLVIISLRSREHEDDIPDKEKKLQKKLSLPIPPQPGLWLKDESASFNVFVETVAIAGELIIAYAKAISLPANRIEECSMEFDRLGWTAAF